MVRDNRNSLTEKWLSWTSPPFNFVSEPHISKICSSQSIFSSTSYSSSPGLIAIAVANSSNRSGRTEYKTQVRALQAIFKLSCSFAIRPRIWLYVSGRPGGRFSSARFLAAFRFNVAIWSNWHWTQRNLSINVDYSKYLHSTVSGSKLRLYLVSHRWL